MPVMVHRIDKIKEQPRFLRYRVNLPAYTADTAGHIENIGLGGVSLVHSEPLEGGSRCACRSPCWTGS